MKFSAPQLRIAWEQVRSKSSTAGIDGITTDLFAGVAEEQLHALQRQLQQERYVPLPAKGFYQPKKSGGQRLIGIPTVRDRIVQRLLLQSIYPTLEQTFTESSYAYRPGHSVAMAVECLAQFYTIHPTWIVKADIAQFFDNLTWALLLTDLEQLQVDPILLRLIEQQLKSGIVVAGQPLHRAKGVLQGGILSDALANLYLTGFDRQCQDANIDLVRYGDDFVIATPSLLQATRILNQIESWLGEIYLTLQPEKTQIVAPHEEFTFLGYQFQAGQIIAPMRKAKPAQKSKTTPPPPSQRPRVCSLVKSPRQPLPPNPKQYWSEFMSTLYVTDQGAYLNVRHQQFQVFYKDELRIRVPVNQVSHIVLFGCCNLSHGAINLALQRRIPILFLSQQGRYFGRLQTEGVAEVEYLAMQVQRSQEPEFVQRQAQSIVQAKLHNSRILLQRLNRRSSHRTEKATKAIADLAQLIAKIPSVESIEQLMGYEGQGAHLYFQALGTLFKEPFVFEKRTRRPPTDPVNSLLSLGYTLVHQNIYSLVQAVGLHAHFGNLHVPRKNHPALVSDLMEEFRAPIVDSLVAYFVNAKVFELEDFTPPDERGGVYLHPDALRRFLKHWNKTLKTTVTHPHTGYKVTYYRCLELQVWEYIACLLGKQEVYRPMTWKI